MQSSNSGTHAVSPQEKKPPTELAIFAKELQDVYAKTVVSYFRGDKKSAQKFLNAVVYSVRKIPALLECDKQSVFQAFMTCAEFELYPSSAGGEAYVIPYKGKAQFQLGYQGLITLGYRSGVESLSTGIVRKGDVFEYEEGLEPKLVHKPKLDEDGEPIAAYAVGNVKGQRLFKVLSKAKIYNFKKLSQGAASPYSPWNSSDKDPELWMWRKTALRQLFKLLPKNDTVQRAIEEDNKDSVVQRQQAALDAAGPAVGRALHAPQEAPKQDGNQDAPHQ